MSISLNISTVKLFVDNNLYTFKKQGVSNPKPLSLVSQA